MPWNRRGYGGFPSARLNYLSLLSLFTENIPQIAVQVVNAEPARGGQGLGGVALVSVAFSATAIVVKTLQKLFEGCGGGDDDFSTGNPMLAGRPRGKTRAELEAARRENEAARREIERLRKAATTPPATPSSPVGPSMVALEMTTLSAHVASAAMPALATPPPRSRNNNDDSDGGSKRI